MAEWFRFEEVELLRVAISSEERFEAFAAHIAKTDEPPAELITAFESCLLVFFGSDAKLTRQGSAVKGIGMSQSTLRGRLAEALNICTTVGGVECDAVVGGAIVVAVGVATIESSMFVCPRCALLFQAASVRLRVVWR